MLVPIHYYELVRDEQLVVQMVYATFRLIFLISIFSQVFVFFDTEIELPLVTQFSRRLFD